MAGLGFTGKYPNENRFRRFGIETLFAARIQLGYFNSLLNVPEEFQHDDIRKHLPSNMAVKIHTMRKRRKDITEGSHLHMYINQRTKKQHQFMPVIKCKRIDVIKVEWKHGENNRKQCNVYINGVWIGQARWAGGLMTHIDRNLKILVQNDGFDVPTLFFEWFDKDFEWDLIQWTDYVYPFVGKSKSSNQEE